MSPKLTVQVLPGGTEQSFGGPGPVTFGRDPAADITILANQTSRRHAAVHWDQASGWVLEDSSSNGTYINGQRVSRFVLTGPVVVHLGDPVDGVPLRLTPVAAEQAAPAPVGPPPAQAGAPAQPAPPTFNPPSPAPPTGPPSGPPPPQPTRIGPPLGFTGVGAPATPPPPDPTRPPAPPMGPPQTMGPPVAGSAQPMAPPPPMGPPPQGFRPAGPPPPPGGPAPGPGVPPARGPAEWQQAGPGMPAAPPVQPPGDVRLGEFTSVYRAPTTSRVRIGRARDNDIVIADLLASRYHAEMRNRGGMFEIADGGSHNGTFVNGRRIQGWHRLNEADIVSIAHHNLHLHEGRLVEYVDTGDSTFAALRLSVLAGGRPLLDDVSFALDAGTFLAVLGPTGAGKSTLLKALTGARPADRGSVLYNGRDLYEGYAGLRSRIGYVPQDDILHPQLTVRRALNYVAQLRFPPDVHPNEREQRVEEVMSELGLTARAKLQVGRLSGGQRKRTSVAIELLTKPSLLVLDEPTSGLDPGYEKSVMELLGTLADSGRTVITVTHSIQSLSRCNRVLFLAPGGQTAYFGPPTEALPFFQLPEYADVFQSLDQAKPGVAKQAFGNSPAEHQYVRAPLQEVAREQAVRTPVPVVAKPQNDAHWFHQLSTLVRRYTSITLADRRNTALLVAQAPILGLLMLAVFGSHALSGQPGTATNSSTVLIALVLGATYLGGSNSVREIVKERPILTRERSVGQSASAYVLSKALLLGVVTVIQAAILTFFGLLRQGGPTAGAVLSNGRIEMFLVVAGSGIAAMALGLAISAVVSNADKALTILPVILFAQFLLSGAMLNIGSKPGLEQLGWLTSARWGYSAAASTADLQHLAGCPPPNTPVPPGVTLGSICTNSTYNHTTGTWIVDIIPLVALTAACLAAAWWAIRPVGQPRRR